MMSPPHKRLAALLLVASSTVAFAATLEFAGLLDMSAHEVVNAPPWVFLGPAASFNLWLFGLVWLSAGLKGRQVWTDSRSFKGFMRLMAGGNLLAALFPTVSLFSELTEPVDEAGDSASMLLFVAGSALAIAVFIFGIRKGVRLVHHGLAVDAAGAEQVLQYDTRRPVVYIRSFMLDGRLTGMYAGFTAEQDICAEMEKLGPVVAIGKPGEPVPELGAARVYVGDDGWRTKILEYFDQAAYVVVQVGPTANLWWEIEEATRRVPLDRLLIFAFGARQETEAFRVELGRRLGGVEIQFDDSVKSAPRLWRLLWRLTPATGVELGQLIHFRADRSAAARAIHCPMSVRLLPELLFVAPYRPYLMPIRHALKDIIWPGDTAPRRTSQWLAIVLALYLGMFGIQHFYLGNRRAGWMAVALSLTGISIVMGCIHSVKLTLLEPEDFERLRRSFASHAV